MNIELKLTSLLKEGSNITHEVESPFEEYLRRKTKFQRRSSNKHLSSKVGVSFSTIKKGANKAVQINPIDAESNNNGVRILFSAISSEHIRR